MSDVSTPDTRIVHRAQSPDLIIVGGGVVGLWCAERAGRLGLKTILVEKGRIGAGASGGFLGALMPHQPVNWTPKKAFQLDALMALETEVSLLEEATGMSCGYRRCGRLMPIYTTNKLKQSQTWQEAASQNWPQMSPTGVPITWDLPRQAPDANWLSQDPDLLACDHETLSARVNPRTMLQALATKVATTVDIQENVTVTAISNDGIVTLSDGRRLSPGHVIVAAGYETFGLLKPITGHTLGSGIKGQAALLRPKTPASPDQPIVYAGGTYIISHDNGLIAVGSTSQATFDYPHTVDGELDDLIVSARKLCPCLDGGEIVERWAGVRPKAIGRDPVIGVLPESENVVLASGGFKISFGIAHHMADAALDKITGNAEITLPPSFEISHHFSSAA
jgi:glycine oxidase